MSTPSSSSARRWLPAIGVCAVAFIGLAMIDEWPVFRPLFVRATPASEPATRPEAAVRAFVAALEEAYRRRTAEPLSAGVAAPAVRDELARELAFLAPRGDAPLTLAAFEIVRALPAAPGEWAIVTAERWGAGDGAAPPILRFEYRLAEWEGGLRVEEVTAIPPEPAHASRR